MTQNGEGNPRKSKHFPWISFGPIWLGLAGLGKIWVGFGFRQIRRVIIVYLCGAARASSTAAISSSAFGSSIVAGVAHSSWSAIFFIVPRRILPERVFGSRVTTTAILNAATGPILSRTSLMTSFSISSFGWL